jgi:hypothetical protein
LNIKAKIFAVLGITVFSLALVAGTAFAQKNDDGTRPGWGWGDKNHKHTGPPGHSVFPGPSVHPSVEAASETEIAFETGKDGEAMVESETELGVETENASANVITTITARVIGMAKVFISQTTRLALN